MKLRRYRKDRYDLLEDATLEYLRELSKIGSVTGTEYRAYDWLLRSVLPGFVSAKSNIAKQLNARFTPGNQLLVSWNGLRQAKRRLLLVAHTDHEGFLGGDAYLEDVGPNSSLWIRAEGPAGESIEQWHQGAHVHVAFGSVGSDERVGGIVEQVTQASQGSAERDYARIRILSNSFEDLRELCERIKNSSWPVVAYPSFEFKRERTEGEIWLRDTLKAPFVDNCAGVAIVTAVFRALIEEEVPTNVSVLYTTGEEAGFVGLLTMIAGADDELQSIFEDAVWLVVDASSQEGSSHTGLHEWYAKRVKGRDDSVRLRSAGSERCPQDVVSIRLEDRCTLFDYSAALLLHQASLRVKSMLFNNEASNEWHWQKHIGVAGEFVKGVCEGTVLTHYNEIRRYLDKSELTRPPRIGSLAIPIVNYRNYAGFNSGKIEPEITRVGALASAAFILFEACCIADRTYLGEQVYARARDKDALRKYIHAEYPDRIKELEEELEPMGMFLRYLERGKELLEPLNRWVDTEGQKLLKGLLQ